MIKFPKVGTLRTFWTATATGTSHQTAESIFNTIILCLQRYKPLYTRRCMLTFLSNKQLTEI